MGAMSKGKFEKYISQRVSIDRVAHIAVSKDNLYHCSIPTKGNTFVTTIVVDTHCLHVYYTTSGESEQASQLDLLVRIEKLGEVFKIQERYVHFGTVWRELHSDPTKYSVYVKYSTDAPSYEDEDR